MGMNTFFNTIRFLEKISQLDHEHSDQNLQFDSKSNQMRSPSRPKIRIFNLEGLRDVESKNILSKS